MRAYVFTDASLARYAGQFVWLSIDIDNAKNAQFLGKFPVNGVPMFLIIDPKKDAVSSRYYGGLTLASLKKLLDDNLPRKNVVAGEQLLADADRLASAGKEAEAVKVYDEALKELPKKSARYGRAAESYVMTLQMTHQIEQCATRGLELARTLEGTLSGANVAAYALDCSTTLDAAKHAATLDELEKMVRAAIANPKLDAAGDDRSGYYEILIGAREAVKDEAGAQKLREQWSAFLDAEAAKAKTAEQRAAYDPHRLSAYIELKEPEKAVPMLQQSERDFPNDYNPPARLLIAYRALGKFDEAIAAGKRALPKSEGPRKLTIYRNLADVYTKKGDKDAARETLREAITFAESLPVPQKSERMIAALKKQVDAIQ
jgi:tetratricopeptide (TPR) repeat protein